MEIRGLKFHHIGVATEDIKASILLFQKLGYMSSEIYRDEEQEVDLAFMNREGDSTVIELVAPYQKRSPVDKILEKNGTMPYHICYEVEDIDLKIRELKKLRFLQITKKTPAKAFDNREICFLYHKNYGMIELLQK